MTDIEQQARKEAIGVAVWHGALIEVYQVDEPACVHGEWVHRSMYIDEQGRRCTIWPRPSEVYLFKPSLMVGFSEDEIERIALDRLPVEMFQLNEDGKLDMPSVPPIDINSDLRAQFIDGLRYANANTRAVSIDKIMEVVREATWINDVDLLRERLMKMAALP